MQDTGQAHVYMEPGRGQSRLRRLSGVSGNDMVLIM